MSQARGAPNLHDSILRMPFGHNTLTHRHAPRRFGTPRIARADRHPPMPTPPEPGALTLFPAATSLTTNPYPPPVSAPSRLESVCDRLRLVIQLSAREIFNARARRAQGRKSAETGARSGKNPGPERSRCFSAGTAGWNRGTDRGRGYSVTPSGNESRDLGRWPQNVRGRSLVPAADGGVKSRPLPLTQPSAPGGGEGEGCAALPRAAYLRRQRHGLWR
jgi:hypothetical protein